MSVEVAPLQVRRTVFIPPTLRPLPLSVIVGPDCAQYLPPLVSSPPQMIISLPVQTTVCSSRAVGALTRLVAVQVSVMGLYLPPVLRTPTLPCPPQSIISLPV